MAAQIHCFILLTGSYLLGSISPAILVTWLWVRKDIRTLGNRNAGAANVARNVGILPAAIVVVADFAKGAIPVLVARWFGLTDLCALLGAALAVIGHSFPVFFRFRGGKGLAATLGALLVLTPLETFLVLPILGLVYLVITGSAVTGAIVALGLLIGLNYWRGYPLILALAPLALLVTMALCAIPQILSDWRQREDKAKLFLYWLSPREGPGQSRTAAVVTDSVASLPAEICSREKIHVVPLALILPDGVYRDGVDVAPRDYYRRLREGGLSPKTSAPSPGEFLNLYQRLAANHQAAIVVTPPKELTQTYEAAYLAGETIADRLVVHVVDSRVAGPAEGFVALAASRLVAAGANPEAIVQGLEKIQKDVGFVGVLDTLKFLIAGGRVREARQWIQSALRLYPVLCIMHGQIRLIGMARTKPKAIERMVRWLESTLPKNEVALAFCHTDAPNEASALAERLRAIFHPTESFTAELTPVIGAHTGPGVVGVAWWVQSDTHERVTL